ncbi:MAG: MT-A70 family methyltransferase [Terrimicrobiaceae bacterium]
MTPGNATTLQMEMPAVAPAPSLDGAALGDSPCSAYRCVVVDPPWDVMKGAPQGRPEGVQMASEKLDYPTMSVAEIAALKIPAADDAHLYIWTINKYIRETYDIAREWGFSPSTMLFWLKTPKGMGLGGAFVPCVEPILFCRRGKLPIKSRCNRNWWGWPRGKHSQKPEAFQTVVESVSPGPYLEMFARRKRPGWHSWGNEVESDIIVPNND